jgi:hypothetical protein
MRHGDLHPARLSRPCIAEVLAVTHANLRALFACWAAALGRTTMKLLLSLGVFLSITLTGCALLVKDNDTQSHYEYHQELPLSVGNYWTYRVTRYNGFNPSDIMTATSTLTDTITNVEIRDRLFVATVQSELSAETLVEVRGNYPLTDALQPATTETYWLIVDDNRVLRQDDALNLSDLQSHVIVQYVFPISLNSQWSMYSAKDAPLNRKVTKVGSVTVPAGTFTDCLYLAACRRENRRRQTSLVLSF